ncbi:hypothetical protein [Cupriavidus sp. TMH.W2]|uniref:hypothetical protein n=1 Tax=Cupriavidus sp. TMH.W2 TaxID=3434465 RepID=UPI003D777259
MKIDDYLAMGLFGAGHVDGEGRYRFARLPVLLGASRREQALAGRAEWSEAPRGWFAGPASDLEALADWLPSVIAPSYFVAQATAPCWQCGATTPVFALAVPAGHLARYDDFPDDSAAGVMALPWEVAEAGSFVSDLSGMAGSVRQVLAQHCPAYHVDYSGTAGSHYLMNHCAHCAAKQGDFYLHYEPGAAFFPTTAEEAARITLCGVQAPLLVQGSASITSDDLLQDCTIGPSIVPGAGA